MAKLVVAGRSNPEIAAELYLSRSTVQTHVSHILTKLGCRSRPGDRLPATTVMYLLQRSVQIWLVVLAQSQSWSFAPLSVPSL